MTVGIGVSGSLGRISMDGRGRALDNIMVEHLCSGVQ